MARHTLSREDISLRLKAACALLRREICAQNINDVSSNNRFTKGVTIILIKKNIMTDEDYLSMGVWFGI